ncbi:MAG: 16S rRNA (adenine(1518)-N(6)/adenine(1519)-N(6))-dimethyltransferase RsmA [Patescibacteria group bacterium]
MERLGQHFLNDQKAVNATLKATRPEKGDAVIEIGPGKGALTLPLAELCKKTQCDFFAIEKDTKLAVLVARDLTKKSIPGVIIQGDALRVLPELYERYPALRGKKLIIVGNIPYYITGHLLRILSELEQRPKRTVLMVQDEVAERIAAEPGHMNLLAAATQLWATPTVILRVPKTSFKPKPKVDSAIIVLTTKDIPDSFPKNQYYAAIKILFRQPRKTLFNNLRAHKALSPDKAREMMDRFKIRETTRPQDLSLELLIKIVRALDDFRVI